MSSSHGSPLDPEVWNELAELGPEFIGQLSRTFLHESSAQLARIREALEAREGETLARLAHTLKGSAGTIGAMDLSKECKRLETAVKESRWDECAAIFTQVEAECLRAGEALKAEVK